MRCKPVAVVAVGGVVAVVVVVGRRDSEGAIEARSFRSVFAFVAGDPAAAAFFSRCEKPLRRLFCMKC